MDKFKEKAIEISNKFPFEINVPALEALKTLETLEFLKLLEEGKHLDVEIMPL